jgi:hypothetical protein
MGKYDPLTRHLSKSCYDTMQMTFPEIEKLLGLPLPRSAYTYRPWWANGGQYQANAWLDAGYRVYSVNLTAQTVLFKKSSVSVPERKTTARLQKKPAVSSAGTLVNAELMNVCGYPFAFLQELIPDCDASGNVIKYYPQSDYVNKGNRALTYYGEGAFCRFRIDADDVPGVYLWVVDGHIIYIGETDKLRRRFNTGYGNISPRNCYAGGQSTNCKMNKVVLSYYENGRRIRLYFYQTHEYKRVERELLNQINTPYNVKNNA